MKNRKDDPAARPDKDNPEWTRAELKKARPALDMVSEVFGEQATVELRRGRGRPPKEDRKVNQTLRIDADMLEAYRQEGKGWQTRINEVLRQNMPNDSPPHSCTHRGYDLNRNSGKATAATNHDRLVRALRQLSPSVRISADRAWSREPALRVIDCVLSLTRNYDRFVVPRRDYFERNYSHVCSVVEGDAPAHVEI